MQRALRTKQVHNLGGFLARECVARFLAVALFDLDSHTGAVSCNVARIPAWELFPDSVTTPVEKAVNVLYFFRLQNVLSVNLVLHATRRKAKGKFSCCYSYVVLPVKTKGAAFKQV